MFYPENSIYTEALRRPGEKKHKVVAADAGHPFMTSETKRISLIFLFCPGETTYFHFMTTVPE